MAGYTNTFVANSALRHLNITKPISDIETDTSKEASACRHFLEIARDELLRDYTWPFATRFITLELVEENPTIEWAFSYRYPTNCSTLRRILSGVRNDNRQSRVPYKIGSDDTGKLIYTDMRDAQAEITSLLAINPGTWDPDFVVALSYRLAAYIAPGLTGGDPFKVGDMAFRMFGVSLSKAFANAKNEEQAEDMPDSELIRART